MLRKKNNFNLAKGARCVPVGSGLAFLLGLLTALSPVGIGSLGEQNASAVDDGGIATFSGWLSSSVTLTMADKVEENIEPTVAGAFKNLSTVAHVQVNNSDYYEVKMHASSKDMTNPNAADAKITSITAAQTSAGFANNQWGYNLTKNTSGSTKVPVTADTQYQPVATTATAIPGIGQQPTTNNAADDYYTMNFGAKVDTSLPAGTYSSTVTLSVVASPKQVTGFDRTDTMQGMTANICREIGTGEDLTNGTAAKYASTDALGNTVYTKQLRDNRDGKYYWVAKLADGNCWMTQNLDLDIPAAGFNSTQTALADGTTSWKPQEATRTTSMANRFTLPCTGASATKPVTINGTEYTNEGNCLNADADHSWDEGMYVMVYPGEGNAGLYIGMKAQEANVDTNDDGKKQNGLSSFGDKGEIIGQSTAERKNATELAGLQGSKVLTDYGVVIDVSSGWTPSTDPNFTQGTTYVDGGQTYTKAKINTGAGEINDGIAIDYARKVYDAHYLIGNYYQWLAATAQTVAQGLAVQTAGQKVEGSICAKGWELPTSGSYGDGANTLNNPTYNSASGSFFNLINKTSADALITSSTSNGSNAQVNNGYSTLSKVISGEGDTAIKTENILTGSPMHFLRAGDVHPWAGGQQVRDVGGGGGYWSSVADSATYARYHSFTAANVRPSYSNNRANGYSVRCLVNTAE